MHASSSQELPSGSCSGAFLTSFDAPVSIDQGASICGRLVLQAIVALAELMALPNCDCQQAKQMYQINLLFNLLAA